MRISQDRLAQIERRFPAQAWVQGPTLHAGAGVQLHFVGELEARATVTDGGRRFEVRVADQGQGGVEAFCSCPIGFACGHIAATLHALAEQNEHRARAPALRELSVPKPEAPAPVVETRAHGFEIEVEPRGRISVSLCRLEFSELFDAVRPAGEVDLRRGASARAGVEGEARELWWAIHEAAQDEGERVPDYQHSLPLLGPDAQRHLETLLRRPNTWLCGNHGQPGSGPVRVSSGQRGALRWRLEEDGYQYLGVHLDDGRDADLIGITKPWFAHEDDEGLWHIGPLSLSEVSPETVRMQLLQGGDSDFIDGITPEESADPSHRVHALVARLGLPPPEAIRVREAKTKGYRLRVSARRGANNPGVGDALEVEFLYDGSPLADERNSEVLVHDAAGRPYVVERDSEWERAGWERLNALGLVTGARGYVFRDHLAWSEFVLLQHERLEAEGWEIEIEEAADLAQPLLRQEQLRVLVDDASRPQSDGRVLPFEAWAEVGFEVEVEGEYVSLLPALQSAVLLAADEGQGLLLGEALRLVVQFPDGRTRLVEMPRARLQVAIDLLVELVDRWGRSLEKGRLRMRHAALMRLGLDDAEALAFHAPPALAARAKALAGFSGIEPREAPASLHTELRDYQKRGLAWLGFLRERGLGGILADDMGLGKTVQALAHILYEHAEGRLDEPVLVVAPRSVLVNWVREAKRFAPSLEVRMWHGLRREHFPPPDEAHIIVTSYATLRRDRVLQSQAWHYVILDEAQAVKNPDSKTRAVIRRLEARHRLCMTGTPLENNLLELWSLFDVLMPGYLGTRREFQQFIRRPIERGTDPERARMAMAELQRRVAPFLLRRSKGEVLPELPPKTEQIEWVQIEGAQAELYETVRASLDADLRAALAERGLAQSQILVLDAMLKLRQVCCDPRLVKERAAREVRQSAKLDRLVERLRELVAAGHRILVFSQFASMLALIEGALDDAGLDHQKLTGATRDRQPLIDRFQAGEVPIFLISLKAGGTGLNLTAADVVIHYDPWWNPAAEDQATDRAHRIGQERPVTVYKMVVEGSIEAAILDLQARKAQLADQVQAGARALGGALRPEDLEILFQPLAAEADPDDDAAEPEDEAAAPDDDAADSAPGEQGDERAEQ